MERTEIMVRGKVQRTGYRDYVFETAVELGVAGYVENQLDGTVKIVAEAGKDILEDFIGKLKPEDDPLIGVNKTDVNYEKATGEFKNFEIRRGTADEESGERLDTAAKSMKVLIKTVIGMNDDLGGRIDNLGGKIDNVAEMQKQTIDKLDSFHHDTIQRFDNLDIKYGRIADIMEKLTEALLRLAEKK